MAMNLNGYSYPVMVGPPQPQVHTFSPAVGPTVFATPVHMLPPTGPVPVGLTYGVVPQGINYPQHGAHPALPVYMSPSAAASPLGPVSPVFPATPGTPGLVYPVSPVSPYHQQGVRLAPRQILHPLPASSFAAQPTFATYPVGASLPAPRQNFPLIYTQPGQGLSAPGTVSAMSRPLPAASFPAPLPQPTITSSAMYPTGAGLATTQPGLYAPGSMNMVGPSFNPAPGQLFPMATSSATGVVGVTNIQMQPQPTFVNTYPGMPGTMPSHLMPAALPMTSVGGISVRAGVSPISQTLPPLPTPGPVSGGLGASPSQISLSSYPLPGGLGASPSQVMLTTPTSMLGGTMPLTPIR